MPIKFVSKLFHIIFADIRWAIMFVIAAISCVFAFPAFYQFIYPKPTAETTRPQKETQQHGGRSVQTPPQSTRTIPSSKKENSRVPQRVGKKEAQEHGSLKNSVDVGNINFQITGSTDTEKRIIERRLVDLEVKSATITITKSELDSSRDVLIEVTYKDNTKRDYSFNTPLDNAANLIISEIDYKRRKQ